MPRNCVVIGKNAAATAHSCIVIGDNAAANKPNTIALGESLFNEPIPPNVRSMLLDYPDELAWFLRVIAKNDATQVLT